MTSRPLLSVIIPTYQRRDSLLRLLTSLRTQTLPADAYEVIAVVDGSTDGTAAAVRSFAAPYPLSALEGPNRGRARSCNAGMRAAAGTFIVLLDDDMEASPGLLAAHASAHDVPLERGVVGAAPIVVSPDSPPFVRYMANGFRSRLDRLGQPGYRLTFRDTYTGNFSVRRDVLLAVGGFDEGFRVYGHEDYELAFRLQHAGVELAYSPEACAYQHYEKSFAGFAPDGIARGRTAVLFAGKHPAIVDRIKLSEFHAGPWRWRAFRRLLLQLSRLTGRVPDWVVAGVGQLERYGAKRLDKHYTLAIDYLYWYGALAAMREQRANMTTPAASAHMPAFRDGGWSSTRLRTGLLLLLLYAAASTVQWLQRAAEGVAGPAADEISTYEDRFRGVRAALPPRGLVGYLGDPEPTSATRRDANAAALLRFRRYLLAQYALAPLLLVQGTAPEFVIGNFDGKAQPVAPAGLEVIRDFGDGVVLFRRAGS